MTWSIQNLLIGSRRVLYIIPVSCKQLCISLPMEVTWRKYGLWLRQGLSCLHQSPYFDEEEALSQTVVIARPRHGTEQETYEQALKDERLIVAIKHGTDSVISHT